MTALRQRGREIIGRVEFTGERVVLENKGRPVAAIVPLADLELLEQPEDQALIKLADESEAEPGPDIPWEQVKAESETMP